MATPIGNLGDLSARAREVLASVDAIAAEDTRHTRRLLAHFGIGTHVFSSRAANERAQSAAIVARLDRGEALALVVDAGSPGISDPGERVVRAAIDGGHAVRTVPGPSAVIAALSVSGLPTAAFTFAGFLPPKAGARDRRLAELLSRSETLVLYEAPHRIRKTLDAIARLAPDRALAACRELTKMHEEVLRGDAGEVGAQVTEERERGEWVLVVSGSAGTSGGKPGDPARERFLAGQIASGATPEEARRRAEFVLGGGTRPGPDARPRPKSGGPRARRSR